MAPERERLYPSKIRYDQLRFLEGLQRYDFPNTREDWYDFALQQSGRRLLFETELSSDATQPENDVLNLQYFFVRLELHLRENKEDLPDYILLIHVPDRENQYRIATYLSMQEKFFPNLYIYVTDQSAGHMTSDTICRRLVPKRDYLRLLPLLRIHEEGLSYSALEDCRRGLSSTDVKKIYTEICDELDKESEKKRQNKEPSLKDKSGAEYELLKAEEDLEAAEEADASLSDETDAVMTPELVMDRENQKDISKEEQELLNICGGIIRKVFKLSGSADRHMDPEEKSTVVRALGEYTAERFGQINLMTQLLWMLSLYTLNKEKMLSPAQTTKVSPKELYLPELEKSFAYAKSFADGILQIVENSCTHTDAKSGYLSVRLHHVDLSAGESNLMEVVTTRRRLMKRYTSSGKKDCIEAIPKNRMKLLPDIPYYLEVNVIDDASYMDPASNKRRLRGITEVFLANQKKSSIRTLRDVFRYYPVTNTEENTLEDMYSEEDANCILDQLTCHYGLHVIQKVVTTNQGICVVRTPFRNPESAKDTGNDKSECFALFAEQSSQKAQKQVSAPDAKQDHLEDVCLIRDLGSQYRRYQGRTRGTEYQILLPMSSRIMAGAYTDKPQVPAPIELLDAEVLRWKSPVRQVSIDLEALLSGLDKDLGEESGAFDAQGKKKRASMIENFLQGEFQRIGASWDSDSYCVYLLNIGQIRGVKLELLAKGLFRYIARMEQRCNQSISDTKRMLLALYFSDETQMQAFIQIYSVFYSVDGHNDFMRGVQLALCQTAPGTGLPEVSIVLMGDDIRSARRTAEIFAYYHSESSLQVLPFLSYLTRSEADDVKVNTEEDEKIPAIFPFDLYLKDVPYDVSSQKAKENDYRISPELDCWFLRRIVQITQNNLRENGYGCKIPDVHVRLGSKMHIETFFEAELLFQNIGNMARFAFLAVKQLCSGYIPSEKPIFLVAYEDYSSILVQYVQKYISSILQQPEKVDYAIFLNQPEGHLRPSTHFQGLSLTEKLTFLGSAEVITLLPVGTTLSTIYTMRDSVLELVGELKSRVDEKQFFNFRYDPTGGEHNIVIILVADRQQEALVEQYWSCKKERVKPPRGGNRETIVITSPDGKTTAKAKYFIQVHASWHNHLDCIDDDGKSRVLVYVDTTSTVPNMIFPPLDVPSRGVSAFPQPSGDEFIRRFSFLEGCITYGHIKNGANHFLYDINAAKYCVQVENPCTEERRPRMTISQWLANLREKTSFVEPGAFNIVVSPLDMENAPFLQLAAEHLFSHSIRFLRIPIMDSRTDDIRTKFSFIARECREIRRKNIPINVYYVDNSIVTGNTFQRGRKLIQMLLQDAGDFRADTEVFRGVLLLINRSRMDTAASMVEDPEEYYRAYLHLAIPHYNTVQGICPGCRFYQRNQRMAESCSTNFLADEFCRLSEKYRLYDGREYEVTQRNTLRRSKVAFRQLCQWLYGTLKQKKGKSEDPEVKHAYETVCNIRRRTIREFLEKHGESCAENNELTALAGFLERKGSEFEEKYLQAMLSVTLEDLLEKEPEMEEAVVQLENIWVWHVLDEKAMLRAYCTHQAYCLLESEKVFKNGKISPEEIKKHLYQLLKAGQTLPLELSHDYPDEQRISYLKILSREYLANYYDIREQIADRMVGLLYALLDLESAEQDHKTLYPSDKAASQKDKSYPLLRYQLLLTLYQQLANLQVNVILKRDILNAANDKIKSLRKEYFTCMSKDSDQFLLCPVMPDSEQHVQFAKCIKWLSLSNDEENNCFLIQRELPLPRGPR